MPFPAMMLSSMKIILLIADFLHCPDPKNYGLFFEDHTFTLNHGLILDRPGFILIGKNALVTV